MAGRIRRRPARVERGYPNAGHHGGERSKWPARRGEQRAGGGVRADNQSRRGKANGRRISAWDEAVSSRRRAPRWNLTTQPRRLFPCVGWATSSVGQRLLHVLPRQIHAGRLVGCRQSDGWRSATVTMLFAGGVRARKMRGRSDISRLPRPMQRQRAEDRVETLAFSHIDEPGRANPLR